MQEEGHILIFEQATVDVSRCSGHSFGNQELCVFSECITMELSEQPGLDLPKEKTEQSYPWRFTIQWMFDNKAQRVQHVTQGCWEKSGSECSDNRSITLPKLLLFLPARV